MPVQNVDIAAMFDQTADLLELKGDNPFRARAYRRAARTLTALPQSVHDMVREGRDLAELPTIGEDLAGKIGDILRTGRFEVLESLKAEMPADAGAMAALPGLGP
ncbi:MAG: DNA polymerase III, partial [Alphaproteobacteria bacterium]|nr:DNA polymerase III [Alphaproteobacteria bacterium]